MTSNKDKAVAFQQMIITGKIRAAYEQYVSKDFFHHNPFFKGDRESLLRGMEENFTQFPNKVFEPKRILEDGDLVAVHSRLVLKPGMPEIATVHIFRFQDGLIAEEWDVGQQLPEEMVNENGVF